MTNKDKNKLINCAKKVSENSYSPYSNFCVGAALLCKNGQIFTGTNIENKSFGATNCAERTAIYSAVSAGIKEFTAIAVVGYKRDNENNYAFCLPCGICRQVLSEFCDENFIIILSDSDANINELTLKDILPYSFNLD